MGFGRFARSRLARQKWIFPRSKPANGPTGLTGNLFRRGHSEYDVFCKSAEVWPVSKEKIEDDFTRYLQQQSVPHYVNDFVRRNKKHIDELHTPRF